jgi:hypothetical protein
MSAKHKAFAVNCLFGVFAALLYCFMRAAEGFHFETGLFVGLVVLVVCFNVFRMIRGKRL